MDDFVDVGIEVGENTIAVTAFKFFGHVYAILTSDVRHLLHIQARIDKQHGYTGHPGNYETMLFSGNHESVELYPFGDLPGHKGIGVFQRYNTEDEARDGHQSFTTRVKKELRKRAKSLI